MYFDENNGLKQGLVLNISPYINSLLPFSWSMYTNMQALESTITRYTRDFENEDEIR